jgi:uncharacterized repeat protein (TIGR03803 family)
VVLDTAGNLYGTTTDGGVDCGSDGCGTVFQLARPQQAGGSWTETLFSFQSTGGSEPDAIFLLGGKIYGTAAAGGENGLTNGVVYTIGPE